jgi:hypothetical protein
VPTLPKSTNTLHNTIRRLRPLSFGGFVTSGLLAQHPALGRETDIPGVRARYPYLVYHRVGADEVVIIHVRNGRRGVPKEGEI